MAATAAGADSDGATGAPHSQQPHHDADPQEQQSPETLLLCGRVTFRRSLSSKLVFYDVQQSPGGSWWEVVVKAGTYGGGSAQEVKDLRDSLRLGDEVQVTGWRESHAAAHTPSLQAVSVTVAQPWKAHSPDASFIPQPAPRVHDTPDQSAASPAASTAAAASAAAVAAAPPDDDDTLTTSCLLQYCAQWPQHRTWVRGVLAKDGYSGLECLVGTPFAADKELVAVAVANCGAALQFAAPPLRADPAIVLRAVRSDPFALGFAAEELRRRPSVVLAALQGDPAALTMADHSLFCNTDFMLQAIKLDATAATYAAPELLSDPAFRAAAKAANPVCLHWFVDTEHFHGLQDPAVQQEFQEQEKEEVPD